MSGDGPTLLTACLRIRRGSGTECGRYEDHEVAFEEGDSVLDGLVRLRHGAAPDLAFQFSCFSANVCKECAVMIDGSVEYACIAKLRPGLIQVDPIPDQRVLRDLVIDSRERDRKGAALRRQMRSIAVSKEPVMAGGEPVRTTP